MGYKITMLKHIDQMLSKRIMHWENRNAQGFEILTMCRAYFPNTESITMDKITFNKYYENDLGAIYKVKNVQA